MIRLKLRYDINREAAKKKKKKKNKHYHREKLINNNILQVMKFCLLI